jgi:ankyrin repeat protein
MASKLLAAGVDANSRAGPLIPVWDKVPVTKGPTALIVSMRYGLNDMSELLLSKGADVLLSDQFGKTALMTAIEFGNGDMPAVAACVRKLSAEELDVRDQWDQNLSACALIGPSAPCACSLAATSGVPTRYACLGACAGFGGVSAVCDARWRAVGRRNDPCQVLRR